MINSTIDHLMSLQKFAEAEIIVADGDPQGSTLKKIARKNVTTILCPQSRARQMNCGAAKSSGDILIFLHADTRLPKDALEKIAAILKDEGIAGGAFDLGIDSGCFAFRIIEKMASWRSRLTRIPYGDQAIFIRRDYFFTLGGFQDIPLMEDVELMRCIKRNRGKIFILKDKVKTSARRWESEGIIHCTLRNWLLIMLYLSGVKPEKLVKFYK